MADIRVLVVDDSALVREILTQGLNAAPGIQVVGSATDPYDARNLIIKLRPDVLTLDVEMPRMNGVEFLRQLMPQMPVPTIMVSALTERGQKVTLEALEAGAVDFVAKPQSRNPQGLQLMIRELQAKVRIANQATVRRQKQAGPDGPNTPATGTKTTPKPLRAGGTLASNARQALVIGASTGGTEALRDVVTLLPAGGPPVLIVQHMPAGFTKIFSERLNEQSAMTVREAVDGDMVTPGLVLIAPGEFHMRVMRTPRGFQVRVQPGEKMNGHCPSVEPLMVSAAKAYGADAVGVILTGMGGDGAKGLLAMRQAGAATMAQDEESSVVFGMPRVAWELGAAQKLVPLNQIAGKALGLLNRKEAKV